MLIALAAVLGAAWRRWWGWIAPKWWPWHKSTGEAIGYRAFQAVIGTVVLFGFCWSLNSWWIAGIATAVAMTILTISAHTRDPFIWIMRGSTVWAEVLQGAVVWGILVGLTALI